jgi:hypothetical protein
MKKKANNPQRSGRGRNLVHTHSLGRATLGVVWRGWVVGDWHSQPEPARLIKRENQGGDVRNTPGKRATSPEMTLKPYCG